MAYKKFHRRIARERSLQILYAYEMNSDNLIALEEGILADIDNANDREFSIKLVSNVIKNKAILDERIGERVNNWELDRIALIDKLLLRMGITELMFFPDIPPKVSINEVIEIAKDYSTASSGKFINGILDAVLINLRKTGKLNKIGRGLVEQSFSKKTS